MTAPLRKTNRRTRNVRITRKGYAILRKIDAGTYKFMNTGKPKESAR